MRRKFLLFVMFSFILFGCGKVKNNRILSMGKPYLITGEELCKKQHVEAKEGCISNFYFDDKDPKDRSLKTEVIAVPLETSSSMIQFGASFLRECSYIEEIVLDSKYGFSTRLFPFERDDTKKGFFVLNINKMKKLGWIDKDNKLTKSICLSPPLGSDYYKEIKELDSVALKNALDEMDAQEDKK
jgi:hypothetical protein